MRARAVRLAGGAFLALAGWSCTPPGPGASPAPAISPEAGVPAMDERAGMAPDDAGAPSRTHDYTLFRGGVASSFVWIPRFEAYQLVNPANCGATNAAMPVGAWVKDPPPDGKADLDWAREVFGGFYAGKYEAARADAVPGDPSAGSGARAGGSPALKVARLCVPWTDIDRADAIARCQAYDPHADLMADDEWAALAVWAMINGVEIQGNNDRLKDITDPGTVFLDDPNVPSAYASPDGKDRALTGTGRNAAWAGDRNLTSHTGTEAGVIDLNGNVAEWTGTVGLGSGGRWLIGLDQVEQVRPADGFVTSLATDPALRRYGLPARTEEFTLSATFGKDWVLALKQETSIIWTPRALRGGAWDEGRGAGLWALILTMPYGAGEIGFRPVLRY